MKVTKKFCFLGFIVTSPALNVWGQLLQHDNTRGKVLGVAAGVGGIRE